MFLNYKKKKKVEKTTISNRKSLKDTIKPQKKASKDISKRTKNTNQNPKAKIKTTKKKVMSSKKKEKTLHVKEKINQKKISKKEKKPKKKVEKKPIQVIEISDDEEEPTISEEKDLEELTSLIASCNNTKVRNLLIPQERRMRHNLVTNMINENFRKKLEDEMKDEVDDDTDEYLEKPEPPVFEEFNPLKYFSNTIKGFKAKLRTLRETFPQEKTKKLADVLIRCKGREDDCVTALLTNQLPPEIKITQEILNNHREEYTKKYEEYEKELKDFNEMKRDMEKRKKKRFQDKAIEDFDNNEIDKLKIEKRIVKIKGKINEIENSCSLYKSKEDENFVEEEDKLYIPGEATAILHDEPRIFTFKRERTMGNELKYIHYRVGESQFKRMSNNRGYNVTKVQYLVTPHLLRNFEYRKKEFERAAYPKQYLMYSPHDFSDKGIDWIRLNNYKPEEFSKGLFFSAKPNFFVSNSPKPDGTKEGHILVCLVLSGRQLKNKTTLEYKKKYTRPRGYNSIIDVNGDQIVVFNQDQVLPYYIISYKKRNGQQSYNQMGNRTEHIEKVFDTMQKSAEVDRQMDDMKKFYFQQIQKKEKDTKFYEQHQNEFMNTLLKKKQEREKKEAMKKGIRIDEVFDDEKEMEDDEIEFTPISPSSDFDFSPTSPTSISDGVFEEDEDEEEISDMEIE